MYVCVCGWVSICVCVCLEVCGWVFKSVYVRDEFGWVPKSVCVCVFVWICVDEGVGVGVCIWACVRLCERDRKGERERDNVEEIE